MLQWIRDNSRHAFIYLLFLLLIAMFVFSLGGGGQMSSSRNPNNVSVVYGQVMTETLHNSFRREHVPACWRSVDRRDARQLGLPAGARGPRKPGAARARAEELAWR
jgi:hypothetical protein